MLSQALPFTEALLWISLDSHAFAESWRQLSNLFIDDLYQIMQFILEYQPIS